MCKYYDKILKLIKSLSCKTDTKKNNESLVTILNKLLEKRVYYWLTGLHAE